MPGKALRRRIMASSEKGFFKKVYEIVFRIPSEKTGLLIWKSTCGRKEKEDKKFCVG